MQGFFTKKETESKTRPDGKVLSCISCGRHKNCNTPKMQVSGDFRKGILNVGIQPNKMEDSRGESFISKEWNYLKNFYNTLGINLQKDCLNTYAVRCNSETNPTGYEIDSCRRFLQKTIDKYKPKLIIFFGDAGLYSLIRNRWKKDLGSIDKWTGYVIPDQDLGCWLAPMPDLYSVINSKSEVEKVIFEQYLEKAVSYLSKPFPTYKEPEIIYLENDLSELNKITSGQIAFDYETTGVKPHAKGHRIVCASVAVNADKVYTFMMPETRRGRKPFTDLLQNKNVRKIAQNMKFEDTWTNVRLKAPVNNWFYDTMQASHIINNKKGVTGLKFQTYVQFGIIDYDSEVSPYLQSIESKNANAPNRVLELVEKPQGKEKLLKYCALDSIYEYRLAELTRKEMLGTQGLSSISPIVSDFPNAYRLIHEGVLALAKAERQGLRIDTVYAERTKKRLTKKIETLEKEFFESKFYKHWQHTVKGKINLNSGDQLGKFLYGVKKIKPLKTTETGKGSTDEEALRLLQIPELDMLINRSKLMKLRDTYLDAFLREQVDGYLHPFYNLHLVQTFRSSSDSPNFQNIPKRDKEAMQIVRKALYARPGHQLLEMDYSGIEVAIAACYHKDKNMIKYITDPTSDMHGDMAKQIFKIEKFDRNNPDHSTLRGAAKNTFVFPQFYGDYYRNNAIGMCSSWLQLPQKKWNGKEGIQLDGLPISKHLISVGLKSFEDFVGHIKNIEKHFWTKRFPDYAKWKETHYNWYLENGYISLKTGFVCKGVMGKNDVINYPVQGAAFHCLLWTLTELTNRMEALGLQSKIVGQIHDAIVFDIYPPELQQVYYLAIEIGTKEILKKFPWIIVPLSMEAELCPVDRSWAEKSKWKLETKSKKEKQIFYYYHAESGSLWESYNDFEEEGNPDGCTEQIEKEQFFKRFLEEGGYTDINGKVIEAPF